MSGKVVFFKSLAIVSALAIGGGYVAWRQVEARKERERGELLRTVDEAWEQELMPGSKNPVRSPMTRVEIDTYLEKGRDFITPIPGIPEGSEGVSNIVPLLPGSKSISMPLFTKDQIREIPALEEPADRELLPSSKIGILKLPRDDADPSKKKDPKLLPSSKSIDWILDNPNRKKSE